MRPSTLVLGAVLITIATCPPPLFAQSATMATTAPPPGSYKVAAAVDDVLTPLPLGRARLAGHVGERIDTVVRARITSDYARNTIYPETIEAFRRRVDDRIKPQTGLWQGEFWGKWILGAIAAQRYTGDAALASFIRRACDEVIATQRDDGYIGTYHDSGFVRAVGRRQNWNVWCRKYTLWGLVESYRLLGDGKILTAAARLMDHLMTEVGPGKIDIIDTGRFVGLPSTSILGPVVMLYRHTGERRYLAYAEYIVRQWSRHPGQPPDILGKATSGLPVHQWFFNPGQWTKAYEFISCIEGLTELHRITGERRYLQAAVNIHEQLRKADRVIFGGIGKNDKLLGAARLLQTECEPCDAVYWQRLSVQLLRLTGRLVYADEIERTMYNVLCAAMKADGSWGVRRLCLSGAHWPAPKHCNLQTHQCCVNNVPRGLLQLAQVAVMSGKRGPTVNLYVPGTATVPLGSGQSVRLEIETDYPASGAVRIRLVTDAAVAFDVRLRIPAWSAKSSLSVNGAPGPPVEPGTYATMRRRWRSGDRIDLMLDMRGRAVTFPDPCKPHVAIERGPIVLARDVRLGNRRIHEPVSLPVRPGGFVDLEPATPKEGFWMVFRVPRSSSDGAQGGTMLMCDYASAGSTWDQATSDFRVWLPVAAEADRR